MRNMNQTTVIKMLKRFGKAIWKGSILAVGVFIWIMAASFSARAEENTIWPPLYQNQWQWHENKTDLTPEEIEAIFQKTAEEETTFLDPEFPNSVFLAKHLILKTKGTPSKGDGIKIDADWKGTANPSLKGSSSCFIPLEPVEGMILWYVVDAKEGKWNVKIFPAPTYNFYFREENTARNFMNAVASARRQETAISKWMTFGIMTQDLFPEQAEDLGKTRVENVFVGMVALDGPADKAGIQPSDVITEFNGIKVKNQSHFESLMESVSPGTKVSLALLRRTRVPDKEPKQFTWEPKTIEIVAK